MSDRISKLGKAKQKKVEEGLEHINKLYKKMINDMKLIAKKLDKYIEIIGKNKKKK